MKLVGTSDVRPIARRAVNMIKESSKALSLIDAMIEAVHQSTFDYNDISFRMRWFLVNEIETILNSNNKEEQNNA